MTTHESTRPIVLGDADQAGDAARGARWLAVRAADHERGPGKVHAWDCAKTKCGRTLEEIRGTLVHTDVDEPVGLLTCRSCIRSLESERKQAEWERRHAAYKKQQDEHQREWWAWYENYLRTPEWRERRRRVMRRAQGICEGCGVEHATQVHHLTYARVGAEMLFDLVAVCDPCHARIHQQRETTPEVRGGRRTAREYR